MNTKTPTLAPALRDELAAILRAVTIVSPQQFVFAGQLVPVPGRSGNVPSDLYPQHTPLLTQLMYHLYQYCYCTRFDLNLPLAPAEGRDDPAFVAALAAANSGQEGWNAGWRIDGPLPTGQLLVRKEGLARAVWPGEFLLPTTPGQAPAPGASASVYQPRESRTIQPGFYFAFGAAPADGLDDFSIVRLYWNVRATGASALMGALTTAFNRALIPFRFKCLTNPAHYRRRDAAVLFIARRHYAIVAALVAALYPTLAEHLDPDTPLFTKRLVSGVGLAEDPGSGSESFGMSRCRILAEGLWQAYLGGVQQEAARLGVVLHQFAQHGLNLETPYLNPGSADRYPYPPPQDDML